MATIGKAIIIGVQPVKPIINIPADALKVRVRLRNEEIGKAFVKFHDRIEKWLLVPTGNVINAPTWELGILTGVNQTK